MGKIKLDTHDQKSLGTGEPSECGSTAPGPPGWRQSDAPDTVLVTHAISGRAPAKLMSHGDRCPQENKARPCQGKGALSQKVTSEQTPGQRKGKAT